jgi:hypothetical protein
MSPEQIAKASVSGIDIQLHTHRHRVPADAELLVREIKQNRSVLEPIVGRRLRHLCYPSNVWSKSQWPALAKAGIETATTCDPGMNRKDTVPLALLRFMDGNDIPQIRFEAELSGFGDLWRGIVRRDRRSKAKEPFAPATDLSLFPALDGSRTRGRDEWTSISGENPLVQRKITAHHEVQAEQGFHSESSRGAVRLP